MIRKALFAIFSAVLLLGAFPVLASPNNAQADLTQTYSDEVITFSYPEDWFKCGCKDTENALAIGNTEEAPSTADLARDEVQVLVIKSMTIWIDETLDLEIDAETPEDVLTDYFRGEDVETYEFDDRAAAAMFVENDEARLESLFLAVELGNGEIGMLIATTRPRDLDQFTDTIFAIGETLIATELAENEGGEEESSNTERGQGLGGRKTDSRNERDEIELSEGYEMEDGDFAFNFPQDWQASENDGAIVMVNDEGALDIESLSDLRRGEVLVFIYPTVDTLSDFDFGADDSAPSTIVSFYASMAMATGFTQDDAMQEPEIGDGDLEASSVLSVLDGEYEQYVLAIENGDGDIITLLAYGAPGELEDFIPTLEAIAASYDVQ